MQNLNNLAIAKSSLRWKERGRERRWQGQRSERRLRWGHSRRRLISRVGNRWGVPKQNNMSLIWDGEGVIGGELLWQWWTFLTNQQASAVVNYFGNDEFHRRTSKLRRWWTTSIVMNLPFSMQNLISSRRCQKFLLSVLWLHFILVLEAIGTPVVTHSQAWCACSHVHVFFTPNHPF